MIFDDHESDPESPVAEDVAGTAYRETLTSVDGFTRGPNGRIKFNKDTKKRRRDDNAMDVDVDLDENSPGKSKKTKKDEPRLGHEFKAKVSHSFDFATTKFIVCFIFQKAAGDVNKGGMEPFAYMPIAQAAMAGRRRHHIGITGKR